MAFLFWSFQTDFSGHGNSILGVGGRGSARAQCRLTLRCIRALCCISGEIIGPYENSEEARSAIIASFVEEGIIDLLLLTLERLKKINTVHTAFSGTAFNGQVFAPPKNPLNAVAEGFQKNLKFFFSNFEVIVFMVYFLVRKVVIEV